MAEARAFPVDIYETKDQQAYTIEALLPGIKAEDIKITAAGDTLHIRVATKGEENVEKLTYVRHERHQGELSRSFTLPTHIDAVRVQATYGQGVLTLQVPKLEVARPKQIEIKVKELAGVL